MSTSTLTASHRSYIARRIRCPQTADDVAQRVEIACWRKGITEPAQVMRAVQLETRFYGRTAARREARARTYFDGSENTVSAREDRLADNTAASIEHAEQLLAIVSPDDAALIRRNMAGESLDSAERGRVFRALNKIRRTVGVGAN